MRCGCATKDASASWSSTGSSPSVPAHLLPPGAISTTALPLRPVRRLSWWLRATAARAVRPSASAEVSRSCSGGRPGERFPGGVPPQRNISLAAETTPRGNHPRQREPSRSVLQHKLRQYQLAGHDINAVIDRITQAPLTDACSISNVLYGRLEASLRQKSLRASAPRRLHPRLMTTQTCNFMIEGTTTWSDTLACRCRTIGLDMAVFGPPAGWCRGRNAARRPASPARRPAPGGHLHGSWRLREDGGCLRT